MVQKKNTSHKETAMSTICWYIFYPTHLFTSNFATTPYHSFTRSFICFANIFNANENSKKTTAKKKFEKKKMNVYETGVPSKSTRLVHTTLSIRMNNEARIIVVGCHKRISYVKYRKPSAYLTKSDMAFLCGIWFDVERKLCTIKTETNFGAFLLSLISSHFFFSEDLFLLLSFPITPSISRYLSLPLTHSFQRHKMTWRHFEQDLKFRRRQ